MVAAVLSWLLSVRLAAAARSSTPSAQCAQLHDEGLQLLKQRQASGARTVLARAEKLDPSAAHVLLLRGHMALLVDRDFDAAERLYERAAIRAPGEAACEHAFGRLLRSQERWQEADVRYAAAMALQPDDERLSEEGLFVRGKSLLIADDPKAAAAAFAQGRRVASPPWQPHYCKELGHSHGLCGDVDAAIEHYEAALALRAIPDRSVLASVLHALAAHHERLQSLDVAVGFLGASRTMLGLVAKQPQATAAASATTQLKLARAAEGLYALGAPVEDDGNVATASRASAEDADLPAGDNTLPPVDNNLPPGDDNLPSGLAAAASHYEAALRLDPSSTAAYDGLAGVLLGTSTLANYGAPDAAALNTGRASALLEAAAAAAAADAMAAASAGCAPTEAEVLERRQADELRERRRGAIASTRAEVVHWQAIVANWTARAPWSAPDAVKGAPTVPRVDAADAAELMAIVRAGQPVVLRHLQRDAGWAGAEAWSASRLEALAGERVVKVSVSESGRFDGAEDGRLWGLSEGDEVLVRPPETHMRLTDLLALLRLGDGAEGGDAEGGGGGAARFYLEYNALHQYLGRELRQMAPCPPQASFLRPLLSNLWLGNGATTSPLHYDEYENLLAQVRGRKELILFPPEDIERLEYRARPKGRLQYEWPRTFTREPVSVEAAATRVIFAASINLTQPDRERREALRRCSPVRCTLQPGETLYLPAFWHHEVYSHAASDAGMDAQRQQDEQHLNIALNFWFRNESCPLPSFA